MREHDRSSLLLAAALAVAAGCAGSYDGPEPASAREEALGLVCEAGLTLTGSFEEGAPQPSDVFGCWPVGTWRFSARVTQNGCAARPALEEEYAFAVTRSPDERLSVAYLSRPDWEKARLKVSSGGGGLCQGGFELFGDEGRSVTRFKPSLFADGSIAGFGEYELYRDPQM